MSGPILCVAQGRLQGKISANIQNQTFYSFQGIPYAKPPIGDLRFKAPEQPEAWTGIRDATTEGSECYSKHMITKVLVGSEDCLFLNVYTPELPTESENTSLKPVMVWIHGGAFREGSSKTDLYGPEYLLTEDIVLVTINYRLGIFGFLNLADPEVPGNAGLKDMIFALKWVQKNIHNFSGNPRNVTIFGESAGAAAVHYLTLSPLAKGLFHKAIMQSGCSLSPFAKGHKDHTSVIAAALKLPDLSPKALLQLLKEMSVEKVFELYEKVVKAWDMINRSGRQRPFAPVIEDPSATAFITEDPIKIIALGDYNKVPMIFGYNTAEGMLVEIKMQPSKPSMPENFETIIPCTLELEPGTEECKVVANKVKEFYSQPEDKLENFYALYSDNYFVRDILCAAYKHAISSASPVYLYRMSVETSLNLFKKTANITTPGVSHGDDIGYLFKTDFLPHVEPGSLEELSVKRFTKYWTNFAGNGNPNANDGTDQLLWKAVTKDAINFMDIGKKLTAGVNPEPERMKFWQEIFTDRPLYLYDVYK